MYIGLNARTRRLMESARQAGDTAVVNICKRALSGPRGDDPNLSDAKLAVMLLNADSPVFAMTPAQIWQAFAGGNPRDFFTRGAPVTADEEDEFEGMGAAGYTEMPLEDWVRLHMEDCAKCADLTDEEATAVEDGLIAHLESKGQGSRRRNVAGWIRPD